MRIKLGQKIIDKFKRKRIKEQFPSIFVVETVLGCNLKCLECAVGNNLILRKSGALSFAQFEIIVQKIQKYCKYLYLHCWGEPLLNSDIIKMIHCASKFTKTNISTNGNMLTPEYAKDLIYSGVTDIIVSIDGMTQATYSKYRVGGNVNKALRALEYLAKYNTFLGARGNRIKFLRKTNIIPQFIVFEHNRHEMNDFEIFCRKLGLTPCFKNPYIKDTEGSVLRATEGFKRDIAIDIDERKNKMSKCQDAYNAVTILADGTIVACCYDHNAVTNFGNIFEPYSIKEIYNRNEYKQFREAITNGNAPGFCLKNCLCY